MLCFLLSVAPAIVETEKADTAQIISICFAIVFGLFGVASGLWAIIERSQRKNKDEGAKEGATTVLLNDVTSKQSVILSDLKEIKDTQNNNHLTICKEITGMQKDIERNTDDINHLGSDVRKIQTHIWGSPPKGQYDMSDAPDIMKGKRKTKSVTTGEG